MFDASLGTATSQRLRFSVVEEGRTIVELPFWHRSEEDVWADVHFLVRRFAPALKKGRTVVITSKGAF